MNILDIIIIIVLLFGFIKGYKKGLVVEVTTLLALIVGVFGAIKFSSLAASFVSAFFTWNEKIIQLVSFALVFIGIVLAISILAKLITKFINMIALGFINKLSGGVFGALKVGIILGIVLGFLLKFSFIIPFFKEDIIKSSLFYEPIKLLGNLVFKWLSLS